MRIQSPQNLPCLLHIPDMSSSGEYLPTWYPEESPAQADLQPRHKQSRILHTYISSYHFPGSSQAVTCERNYRLNFNKLI